MHAPDPRPETEKDPTVTSEPVETPVQEKVAAPASESPAAGSLEEQARRLASEQKAERLPGRKVPLTFYLNRYRLLFNETVRHFKGATEEELTVSYAAEWVLDNSFLVQQVLREIGEDLPQKYYRQLPKLLEGRWAGYPRVFGLAYEIVRFERAHLDPDRIESFVTAYESVTPLTMGELWALPIMLRLGIVQALVRSAGRLAGALKSEEAQALPLIDLSAELSDDEVVANCFTSLRTLAAEDWKEFFEDLSLVELMLNRDPAGLYPLMDFETRDRYRKVIEELALATPQDEQGVTRTVLQLAQQALDQQGGVPTRPSAAHAGRGVSGAWDHFQAPRRAHVGYYLVDQGRRELEERLAYRPAWPVRLEKWVFAHPTAVFLGGIAALSLLFWLALMAYAWLSGGGPLQLVVAGLLLIVPSLTVAINLVNWLITNTVKPRVLPKMDFSKGIPEDCKAMVAIPGLLASPNDVKALLSQLELHLLRNPDPNLRFALLTDFNDAPQEHMEGDRELAELAFQGIQALNEKYPRSGSGPFFLFHRRRQWNPGEGRWMGWERKRGKLHELNCLILGDRETSFTIQEGDLEILPEIRYVITLDADTILPSGSAQRLVAALAHPLNRAVFAPERNGVPGGEVVAGYTVLQPRTEINPTAVRQSLFTRIFAGDTGLDLYTLAVSDVYQDFFGEGIYVGKGIYDVRAFERSLAGRVPENALLSHDLFEGIHGRVGLATDIVLIEDYPSHYLVHANRLHRWVRGDWQLLPWLFPRVPAVGGRFTANRLDWIDRWKILDNLRRSLVSPVLLVFFLLGWLWLPGSPLVWTLAGALSLAVPLLTSLLEALNAVLAGKNARGALWPVEDSAARWLLALTFLPYEALLNLDAIAITLYRVFVSRRRLLQWTTTAQSERMMGDGAMAEITWKRMLSALGLSAALSLIVALVDPHAAAYAAPLLIAWLFSPEIAFWISRPVRARVAPLTLDQYRELRRLARRTWLFFEQFVGPEDQWLPPDHYQESPLGVVAHRTSPTNIGLSLLSSLAAYDLGYIGPLDLIARLRTTFEALQKLERFRGHFINWFDTRNLQPLTPRYVSTVDSGNLAACLMVLGQGCLGLPAALAWRWERWEGFLDTLGMLRELLETLQTKQAQQAATALSAQVGQVQQRVTAARGTPDTWPGLLEELSGPVWEALDRSMMSLVENAGANLPPGDLRRLRIYSQRIRHHLDGMNREVALLLPWLKPLEEPPALFTQPGPDEEIRSVWQALLQALPLAPLLRDLPAISMEGQARLMILREALDRLNPEESGVQQAVQWCDDLNEKLQSAGMSAKVLQIGFEELYRQSESLVREMDFSFLFDPQRQVFHIGYNLEIDSLDQNYYDLLASESRIASLVAISKGDVPPSHWLHLSRPLTQVDHTRALLSWSATMFEYLMPALFLRSYPGTLLNQTDEAAVTAQIAYGGQKGVPWGMSESGYYRFDANLYYQYRAFGVPGLGYKRGLGDDLVVAPYASLLALSFRPQAVMENLSALYRLNMLGTFGLYEAIDFTPARVALGDEYEIVQSYMSHHQGMIFLSLVNAFTDEIMVKRFQSDPRIQSVNLLLQEQIPQNAPVESPHTEDVRAIRPEKAKVVTTPWQAPVQTAQPRLHFLSNGHYGLLITSAGSGYSSWRDLDLTRWRADTTRNNWGTWIYVQDLEAGKLWSAGFQPTAVHPESQDVYFNAHMAEFRRRDNDITVSMEITIAPEDDVEVRRITVTNHSDRPRRIALSSYAEIILAVQATDERHPAFNKLFIESEYLPATHSLLFRRRPRSEKEAPVFLAHTLVLEQNQIPSITYEGDRAIFLGRGQTPRSPQALRKDRGLSGTVGATLDPIMALRQEVKLEPHGSARLAFLTLASDSRPHALDLAGRYQAWHVIERVFDQARSQAEVELRQLGLTTRELARIDLLLSLLLFPHAALRAAPETLVANSEGQSALWAYSISGDYPILLVKIANQEQLTLVQELLKAHAYWRNRQLKIDLVILNERGTGYGQELSGQLHRLLERMNSDAWLNRRGGIFVVFADRLSERDRVLLETAARVILDASQGSLARQLQDIGKLAVRLPPFSPSLPVEKIGGGTEPVQRPEGLQFFNGTGGFSPDGKEYVVYLEPGQWTPAPWINVVANPDFGFLISEAGSGYSWSINSGENRLTPWHNDPVIDPPGEALYLRDEETAEVWSPTPLPARAPAPYLIRHGTGYSVFEHTSHGLRQRLRVYAAPDDPVKIYHLRLENTLERGRRITATFYAEWVLGVNHAASQQYIVPEYDGESQALLARNAYNVEFGERVAFAAANKPLHGLTADRTEFLGRMGSWKRPAALSRIGLASTIQAGSDPCAALQLHVDLKPGGVEEIFFLLGEGEDKQEALRLVTQYKDPGQVQGAWEACRASWDDLLGTVAVETPDPAMNLLLNRWLVYQALSCRIWGRSALYQSSGAYGFRDQLQDVMAVVFARPEITRRQILRAARHQFEAGDVLHWWHPPSGRGVRTRISDDLLWLPFVTAHYVAATGDVGLLSEKVIFQKGPTLEPDQDERYGQYQTTESSYTVFEHCIRALQKGSTSGPHNLPLIGTGDWNDGLNRVGEQGRGESVWLGWFLYATLERFAGVCDLIGESSRANQYRRQAESLAKALHAHTWDGDWYLRAYYDDGAPLGSAKDRECRIDSIAQSWAVLSGAGEEQRNLQAMQSVTKMLVQEEERLILLFTPPFDRTPRYPGYIKGYLPGIRENGAQYTHAALWSVWAFAELGQGDYAERLFRLLNPVYHSDTPQKVKLYKVEPYVVAADVYSVPPHTGRGGWTWYTGSAGWMYRLGLEAILGLYREGDSLKIDPCIPSGWPAYQIAYRFGKTTYSIQVKNPEGVNRGVRRVKLDGKPLPEKRIPLTDDEGAHTVLVELGG